MHHAWPVQSTEFEFVMVDHGVQKSLGARSAGTWSDAIPDGTRLVRYLTSFPLRAMRTLYFVFPSFKIDA
jgi:hypothetical protein